ncbi:WGR domain-containing protein [Nostoc sp. GT001]|uniref:WGR domain-containing protein n=1 Tax=Nostoc sp. GT001 TaxID=3056647 RepID=UPI0025AACD22|nr:WGR domain-containing protein [Nostoc sp. GT001]MDM9580188.1 WGR domain-containing protein [Nostoc sp. GT001]
MEIYLVFVDTIQNSNKFWSAIVEDGNLTVQWGRVGYQAQTKVHTLGNHQRAIAKFHNLVAEKKGKGYRESQPEIDASRSVADIRRAIQLLNIIRPAVALQNFGDTYISALNEYLKIVPTPLGIVSAMLFGISALGYWGLEIVEANTIPIIEERYDWQTQKHICFGWMLVAFSSFLGSASFGNESH